MKGYLLIAGGNSWLQRRLLKLHLKIMEETPSGKEKDFALQTIAGCMAAAGSTTERHTVQACTDQLLACQLSLANGSEASGATIAGIIGCDFLTITDTVRRIGNMHQATRSVIRA